MNDDGQRTPFFRRYVPPDYKELAAEIAKHRYELARARMDANEVAQLEHSIALGFKLFMGGNEAEAAPVLEEALLMAQRREDHRSEIEVLLGLGTARQYLGAHEIAQQLFEKGLALSEKLKLREQEHFLLHHRGRCYAEQGRVAEARICFQKALELREAQGNQQLIDSSKAALAELSSFRSNEPTQP
jgi:tetratricopeptide (TPR) repeat protein